MNPEQELASYKQELEMEFEDEIRRYRQELQDKLDREDERLEK